MRIARAGIVTDRDGCVAMLPLQLTGSGHVGRVGSDQRQQSTLKRALVQLDLVADPEAADHVEQLLQRDALGIEQQLVAGVEDAQVAEHLALRSEKRGVAAVAWL